MGQVQLVRLAVCVTALMIVTPVLETFYDFDIETKIYLVFLPE